MTTSHSRRHTRRSLALGLALATAVTATAPSTATAGPPRSGTPDFGPNVTIFSPDTPIDEIQATMDARHAAQVDAEMGTDRHAYLFLPGDYGNTEQPLQVKLGYYTQVSASAPPPPTSGSTERSRSTTAASTTAPATASRWSTSGGHCPTWR